MTQLRSPIRSINEKPLRPVKPPTASSDERPGRTDKGAQQDKGLSRTGVGQCASRLLDLVFMLPQVYWNYFDNQVLLDSRITIQGGDPNQNVIYTTACRLVAMIAASVLVLVTQNPAQFVVVMLMSAIREAQEGFIDPLYPMADSPISPTADFVIHVLIVAAEVAALVVVCTGWPGNSTCLRTAAGGCLTRALHPTPVRSVRACRDRSRSRSSTQ